MAENNKEKNSAVENRRIDLTPKKKEPIVTSQGTFYARYLSAGDLESFTQYLNKDKAEVDFPALGRLSIHLLVGRDEKNRDTTMSDEVFDALTNKDIEHIAAAVAKANDTELLVNDNVLSSLGEAIFDQWTDSVKQAAELSSRINRTLNANFASVSAATRAALGVNLTGLSKISESINTWSPAVEAMRKAQESYDRATASSVLKTMERAVNPLDSAIRRSTVARDMGKPIVAPPTISAELFRPPKFEETAHGRAVAKTIETGEESVKQLRELAGLMTQMANQMQSLQTLFLTEVLPQWFQNLEEGSKSANRSLFWAKWALIGSVIVSVLMTGWQVWLAREYRIEDGGQQATTDVLMRQQLSATQQLTQQLARDSKELRQELATLRKGGDDLASQKNK